MKALKMALSWFVSCAAAALLPLSVLRARPALSSLTGVLAAGFALDFFSALSFLLAVTDFDRLALTLETDFFSNVFLGVFSFLTALFDLELRVSRFKLLAGVFLRADFMALLAIDALPEKAALATEALVGDLEGDALTTEAFSTEVFAA